MNQVVLTLSRRELQLLCTALLLSFLCYHLSLAGLFHVGLARYRDQMGNDWIGDVLVLASFAALYAPPAYFFWRAIKQVRARAWMLMFMLASLWVPWHSRYPVLTEVLYQLGQFEQHGLFWTGGLPSYIELYPDCCEGRLPNTINQSID
ncbi:MAG: hypothetical protein N4A61_15860 [Pelagimonas sp.]|jgi:hypothetical protein|nr:hypothetical protein [Pelagimonas sp.]